MYCDTMYSQELSVSELQSLQPALSTGTVWSTSGLLTFAVDTRSPEILMTILREYQGHLMQCQCWHCEAIKARSHITGLDFYFRLLILINYSSMKIMFR
jgi:hypothetical protein